MKKLVLLLIMVFTLTIVSCSSEKKTDKEEVQEIKNEISLKEKIIFATDLINEVNTLMEKEEFLKQVKTSIDPMLIEQKIPDINLYVQTPKVESMRLLETFIDSKSNGVFKGSSDLMDFLGVNSFYPFDPADKQRIEGMNVEERKLAASLIKYDLIPLEISQNIFQDLFTPEQLADLERMAPEQEMFNIAINDLSDLLLIAEEK